MNICLKESIYLSIYTYILYITYNIYEVILQYLRQLESYLEAQTNVYAPSHVLLYILLCIRTPMYFCVEPTYGYRHKQMQCNKARRSKLQGSVQICTVGRSGARSVRRKSWRAISRGNRRTLRGKIPGRSRGNPRLLTGKIRGFGARFHANSRAISRRWPLSAAYS